MACEGTQTATGLKHHNYNLFFEHFYNHSLYLLKYSACQDLHDGPLCCSLKSLP